jgi:hypothetical protein
MNQRILAAALGTLLVSGCAIQQKEVMHTLENPAPVNCATAEGDLRVLQSEKTHVAQQIVEGVASLTPAGAALGILTLTETTKWKVAVGEYNKMIDKRMAQIKAECGL